MFSFVFVYLGALHRHKYHGMVRIDYTSYLEYNQQFKYFFHLLTMLLVRIIIIGSFFVLFGYGPQLLVAQQQDKIGYFIQSIFSSVIPCMLLTFLLFAYYEYLCQKVNMDANNFELINQSDNNHQMINESCIYNKDYLDLDTSQEDNRPGQTPGDDVVA